MLLLRSAVIGHLKQNSELAIDEYKDWSDPAFENFLSTIRPSFALVSPFVSIYAQERAKEYVIEDGIPVSWIFAAMQIKIFSSSVALAFMSDMHFKDRFIWAESVQPFNIAEHSELGARVDAKLLSGLKQVFNKVIAPVYKDDFAGIPSDEDIPVDRIVASLAKSAVESCLSVKQNEFVVSQLASLSAAPSSYTWRYVIAALGAHNALKASTTLPVGVTKSDLLTVIKVFLSHLVLATHLPAHMRPRANLASATEQPPQYDASLTFLTRFVSQASNAAISSSSNLHLADKHWDLIDIIDSRLMLSILSILSKDGSVSSADKLGFNDEMIAEISWLWSVASSDNTIAASTDASVLSKNTASAGSFLPLSNDAIEVNVSSKSTLDTGVEIDTKMIPVRSTMVDRMIMDEDRPEVKESDYIRWYEDQAEARAQVVSYPWKQSRALDFSALMYYDKEYEERRTNKVHSNAFHAAWAKLAQSLDARPTQTAVLQPKVLMANESTKQQAVALLNEKLSLESQPKSILNDTREKEQARVKNLVTSWRGSPLSRRISTLASFIPTTVTANFDWLYALLDVHIEQYRVLKVEKETAAKSNLAPDTIDFVQHRLKTLQRDEIFDQCVSMIVQCGVGMLEYRGTPMLDSSSAVMKRLTEIFDTLGLTSLHDANVAAKVAAGDTSIKIGDSSNPSGDFVFPSGEDTLQSASRFQLTRMGPWMKRDVGAVLDPRAGRLLDSWQIDVLNCIDSYKSNLVVAPTSAGKSFMGFHAMSRTLESEDGVLVYVAPTKALVNQVVAEVYSKFSKANSPPGTVICGAFTREMRIAPIYARILVTVPQCLEILLLSRELAGPGGWRSKLKWVIFDEIHCINMDDGAIWERLLPLVPCPFMALSATVGDVDRFQAWLHSLATAKQQYADERPAIVFAPKKEEESSSTKGGVVSSATSSSTASAATSSAKPTGKGMHPKIAEKLAKKQGGKGKSAKEKEDKKNEKEDKKNAKKAAAAAAAAATEDETSLDASSLAVSTSSTPATTSDEAKFAGFVNEDFKFINYPHRYSDLYKYIMVPRFFADGQLFDGKKPKPDVIGKIQILSELRAMHPWMGLPISRFTSGSPPTSSFSPREALQVYEAMAKLAAKSSSSSVSPLPSHLAQELYSLKPESFFQDGSIIDQRIMRRYEKSIKDAFLNWASQAEPLAELVLKELTGDMLTEISDATSAGIPLGKDLGSETFLLESLPAFVEGLKEQSWLPAIVFNFDPQFCERMAIALNAAMVEKEAVHRSSAEYRNARIKYIEEMKEWEAEQKRKERASKKKKDKRNDEDLDKEGDPTMDMPVDPDYELADGTTFTRDGEVEPLDDLKRELTNLKNRGINGLLVDGIRRGIGVHHNGLDKKYRQAVEHHFRTGQIKIVFSTETLALGMNMPCRTTVFAGDSPNLTPLQYRQMSGRAGRRGYDPLGRVIFWGIPIHRITYLEGAKLAPIRGQFPLSLSFNLRGLVLGTADVTGIKKKKKQIEEEATAAPIQPGAKKAAAKKAAAAAAKKAAAASATIAEKAPKSSWDDSSDDEDDDDEAAALIAAKNQKVVKSSWDDSSDDEQDDDAALDGESPSAAAALVVEDEVLIGRERTELPSGATEIFKSLQHVYTHSLYLHQHPEMQSQLDIHTQCSLQYMVRLGMISPLGKPIGLAGIACHLNWAEPANIVFAKFLTTDIVKNMCMDKKTTLEEKAESLLVLTAHLFSRVSVPAHRAGIFKELIQARAEGAKHSPLAHCTHMLFLPPLPKKQQDVIDEHNREVLQVLNSVILPYASKNRSFDDLKKTSSSDSSSSASSSSSTGGSEKWLHLSKLSHLNSAENASSLDSAPAGSLLKKVASSSMPVVARSPLAALGGHGDLFATQADLRTMRHGLAAADFGMLVNEDAHGVEQPLNSYLVDLYKFGNYEWLRKFNMFADSDLFFHCNEYLVNMRTLRTAILHRAQDAQHDAILKVLSKLTKEFEKQFNAAFKLRKRDFAWITVRGVDGYSGDLQKHILATTRISVPFVRKVPTLKNRSYIFRIPCRNESDKSRLTELFSAWANDHWWLDEADSDDEAGEDLA